MLRAAFVLLSFSAVAHAQPTLDRLGAAVLAPEAERVASLGATSPAPYTATRAIVASLGVTAVGLALGTTLSSMGESNGTELEGIGLAVMVVGPVVGLSAGNLWLGQTDDALVGMGLRALGAASVAYGVSSLCIECSGGISGEALLVTVGGGSLAFLVGTGYDLVTQYRNGTHVRLRATEAGLGVAVAL